MIFQRRVIAHEGKKYDPNGDYVKQWVPELKYVPKEYIHEPWTLTKEQQLEYSVQLGMDYPNPFIDPMIGEARRKKRAEKRERLRDSEFLRRVKNREARKSFR
jgi:deoxyribodipyrimidine photolyase